MKKLLAAVMALALSLGQTASAANLWELRDDSNVLQGNITDAATPVIEQMDLAGNAGTATALASNGSNCSAGQYPLGVDASGAAEGCTADDDSPDSDGEVPDAITIDNSSSGSITLEQGTAPSNSSEGRIQWDTDDNRLVVGDGSTTQTFYAGPHTSGHSNGANCSAGQYPLGVDENGAVESCTADDDAPDSDAEVPDAITVDNSSSGSITLSQSASEAPTAEGLIGWDSDDDRIVVGDGATTQTFYSGAHTTNTDAESKCAAGQFLEGDGSCTDVIEESELASLANLNTQLGTSIADGAHTTDTNANTACTGTTTYLDGEGNCDDISSVYQASDADLTDLADGSLTGTKLDFIQQFDTKANICASSPSNTSQWSYSTDTFDIFTATGTAAGQWRNSRTGAGPC